MTGIEMIRPKLAIALMLMNHNTVQTAVLVSAK